jgi:hypothetical protein
LVTILVTSVDTLVVYDASDDLSDHRHQWADILCSLIDSLVEASDSFVSFAKRWDTDSRSEPPDVSLSEAMADLTGLAIPIAVCPLRHLVEDPDWCVAYVRYDHLVRCYEAVACKSPPPLLFNHPLFFSSSRNTFLVASVVPATAHLTPFARSPCYHRPPARTNSQLADQDAVSAIDGHPGTLLYPYFDVIDTAARYVSSYSIKMCILQLT